MVRLATHMLWSPITFSVGNRVADTNLHFKLHCHISHVHILYVEIIRLNENYKLLQGIEQQMHDPDFTC